MKSICGSEKASTRNEAYMTPDDILELRQSSPPKGNMDFTVNCGGVEYSSPEPAGTGNMLERFLSEDSIVKRRLELLRQDLPRFAALGVTAVEVYVRWNFIEEQPGVFDFSIYDAFLDLIREYGLKWVPLVIMGPAYTLPKWFKESAEFVPYRCLEHDMDNGIVSIWNPYMRQYVDRFLKAFVEHYDDKGSIQSLMIGISGNYGENLYPHDADKDWTTNAYGDYHSHFGWWAGDEYAKADFRRFLRQQYYSIDELNKAWNECYEDFEEVFSRVPQKYKTMRARFDFMQWYVGSMTEYLEFWLKTARKYMPEGELLISTGGHGLPRVGSDFSNVAKLAAKYNAGVRITNEGRDYTQNFAMTRWISSATRFYGAWLGTEPASLQVEEESIVQRVFNAETSGAKEFFCYVSPWTNKKGYAKLIENLHHLEKSEPICSVAYWIPKTHMMAISETNFIGEMQTLRTVCDFDAIDGTMIIDGSLDSYKILVMIGGYVEEEKALSVIVDWVKRGGILLRIGFEPLTTVDGVTTYHEQLFEAGKEVDGVPSAFGNVRRVGAGLTVLKPFLFTLDSDLSHSVSQIIYSLDKYHKGYIRPLRLRSAVNGVFATHLTGKVVVLNTNSIEVSATVEVPIEGRQYMRKEISIPKNSICSVLLERRL